jgi:hypothetical protein
MYAIKLMYERAGFRAVGLLKEPRLYTASTIECINSISEKNIKLRMGFHKSMNRMDNVSVPREECDITARTVLLYVLFCLICMYCPLSVLHTVHTVHVPCFPVSDVEVSSSTSVHTLVHT